jgi:hypothetical protein
MGLYEQMFRQPFVITASSTALCGRVFYPFRLERCWLFFEVDENQISKVTADKCPACNGIGFPAVKQPSQPERKIYPAPCIK